MAPSLFAITPLTAVMGFVASGAVVAQEPPRAGDSRLVPHVSASAALDLRNGQTRYPALHLGLASVEWTTAVSGLTLRFDGVYGNRKEDVSVEPQDCGAICTTIPGATRFSVNSAKISVVGATFGGTYDLIRHGALRPYVGGGVGIMRTRERSVSGSVLVCPTCLFTADNTADLLVRRDEAPLSGAGHVTAGVAYSWRWLSVIADARYYGVANRNPRGLNGAFPVSLGVRF